MSSPKKKLEKSSPARRPEWPNERRIRLRVAHPLARATRRFARCAGTSGVGLPTTWPSGNFPHSASASEKRSSLPLSSIFQFSWSKMPWAAFGRTGKMRMAMMRNVRQDRGEFRADRLGASLLRHLPRRGLLDVLVALAFAILNRSIHGATHGDILGKIASHAFPRMRLSA